MENKGHKNENIVIYRETLFIRKTCLSGTSCFEIITSQKIFPKAIILNMFTVNFEML